MIFKDTDNMIALNIHIYMSRWHYANFLWTLLCLNEQVVCYDMIWKNVAALILQFSSAFQQSMLSGILA